MTCSDRRSPPMRHCRCRHYRQRRPSGTRIDRNQHIVGLMGVGARIVSRHRNVDRGIDRDRSMHHRSEEGAIATIAGAVATGVDRARADRPECADAFRPMGYSNCRRHRQIPAIWSRTDQDTRCSSEGRRLSHRRRTADVERSKTRSLRHQAPGKIAVAAIAGAVISRVDREERPRIRRSHHETGASSPYRYFVPR